MKTIELRYPTGEALMVDYEQNLKKGRAFVPGSCDVAALEPCELVVVHPATHDEFRVRADAVFIDTSGVGLDLVGLDADKKEELASFAKPLESSSDSAPESPPRASTPPPTIHERVRHLSTRERDDMARHGTLAERVALERAFGGVVWEGLFQNPQITSPEIARIAKMGNLSKPLVSSVINNASWLAAPEVQRALLSNPRCAGQDMERVLRAMKPAELTRLAQHCPYRPEVRAAAVRLSTKK